MVDIEKKKYVARWKTHLSDFNKRQQEIANLAVETLKGKPADSSMGDGEFLRRNHPEVNARYERMLHYFGLM